MGIFFKKEEAVETVSEAEMNEKKLEAFVPTRALGIKKYPEAMQFIYDEDHRRFVVVEGPEETFRDRKPTVIDFREVIDVYLHADQYWTEERKQKKKDRGTEKLAPERYGDVFWHYNFYLHILTSRPGMEEIVYKMNYRQTVLQVPSHDGTRRGLELSGVIRNKGYTQNIKRLESWVEEMEMEGTELERSNMAKINAVITQLKRARKIHKLLY